MPTGARTRLPGLPPAARPFRPCSEVISSPQWTLRYRFVSARIRWFGCGRPKGRAAGAIAPLPCPTGQAAASLTAPGKRVRVTRAYRRNDSAAIAAENPTGFYKTGREGPRFDGSVKTL